MGVRLVGFPCLGRVSVDPGTKESPVLSVPRDGLPHYVTIQLDVADAVWDDPTNADARLDLTIQQSIDGGATWAHYVSGNAIPGGSRSPKDGTLPWLRTSAPSGRLLRAQVACNKRLTIGIIARVE